MVEEEMAVAVEETMMVMTARLIPMVNTVLQFTLFSDYLLRLNLQA